MNPLVRSLFVLGSVCAACGQTVPKLKSISQEYIQRGAAIELTIEGENLPANPAFLIAGDSGLTLTPPPPAQPPARVESSSGGISTVAETNPNRIVAKLSVASEAALGLRELRIAGPEGVSNPLNIAVSPLPEFAEKSDATSLDKAQIQSIPFAVTAKINAPDEIDFYRFSAKKGQRVILETIAQRLGSQLDSSLVVLDQNGRELARNEDAVGNDSVLEFVAPDNADYIAQIRDYRARGGNEFNYRLLVSFAPYVTGAYPIGARRGETADVELFGYNLQGAEKMKLQIDPATSGSQQELRAVSPNGPSNPFPFVISDLPQFLEQEPNSSPTHANSVSLPGAINGRIQNAKDYDAFKFRVETNQRFVFEVAAQRYGSPLDALLTLTDERGNVLQRNDDANGPDARIDQTFAAAGEYILFIEDLLERGGREFTYRISATQPAPGFEVKLVNDTARLPRGGRAPIRCEVTRANGFNDPIRISAKNLPPGLHAESLVLTANDPGAGLLFISAASDAPLGSATIELSATATIAGKNVSRPVKTFAMDRAVKAAYVTVLEDAPFLVHPGQLLAMVEQDQSVNIDALIERRDGFDGEIKISLEGFSAGREPVTRSFDYQPATIKAGEARGSISIKARQDSEVGARMMVLRGDATVAGQTVTQYSPPFPVATAQIPFLLTTTLKRVTLTAVPAGSTSAAAEANFAVRVERRAGFNGEIALKIEGLPEGVTATADKVPAGGGESNIKLVASDKAAVGKEVQLTLTGAGLFKDKNYQFKPPTIGLLVNAPEPTEVKTAEARPAETASNAAK
jgi:hypothetical protein